MEKEKTVKFIREVIKEVKNPKFVSKPLCELKKIEDWQKN